MSFTPASLLITANLFSEQQQKCGTLVVKRRRIPDLRFNFFISLVADEMQKAKFRTNHQFYCSFVKYNRVINFYCFLSNAKELAHD